MERFAWKRHFNSPRKSTAWNPPASLPKKINSFETSGEEYLKSLAVQEAVYESAAKRAPVEVGV